jgi:hypothetical protein
MKLVNKFSKSLVGLALLFSASSCSLFDLDINNDPNNPSTAPAGILLTRIETDLADILGNHETTLGIFMGLQGTQGTSRFDVNNNTFNDVWGQMYTGPLKEVEDLLKNPNPHFAGIGQVLKAYAYATMVDQFGDVPFTKAGQANLASGDTNATFDKDATIYTACLKLIDDAIVNLKKTVPAGITPLSGDVIYGNSAASWLRMATSLKLKMLMTARLAIPGSDTTINKMIKAGGFITKNSEDFQFQFSKNNTSLRHPYYTGAYTGGEFDATYITHQLMTEMYFDNDPRWAFYFKRQIPAFNVNLKYNKDFILNPFISSEANEIPIDYLILNKGFIKKAFTDKNKVMTKADSSLIIGMFGRTRGDMQGIPADGSKRLLPGVYPCGGFHDARAPGIPAANAAPGGGIFPMITNVHILYYQIEAALKLGGAGDAKKLFEQAIRDHIAKVVDFGVATDASSVRPVSTDVDAYVNIWLAKYDAASSTDAKLDVCMKQQWFSSFGSTYESFNAFRRLGMPTTIDEHVVNPSRGFPLRMPYSQIEISLNKNAPQGVIYDKNPIFWDK